MIAPFMSQNTVSIIFFTDHCTQNFFFIVESVFLHCRVSIFLYCRVSMFPLYRLSFQHAHRGKPKFRQFVNIFWTKTCFSIYIRHFSVNFSWFALLNYQKFDDRSVFKPGTFSLIFHHFELPQNNYFCKIEIIVAINSLQTMQSLHL